MLVVNVRVMRVAVSDDLVLMQMGMGLGAIPGEVMLVPMMFVMHVRVAVQQWLVRVQVVMTFGEMQPDARCHQSGCYPERNRG